MSTYLVVKRDSKGFYSVTAEKHSRGNADETAVTLKKFTCDEVFVAHLVGAVELIPAPSYQVKELL